MYFGHYVFISDFFSTNMYTCVYEIVLNNQVSVDTSVCMFVLFVCVKHYKLPYILTLRPVHAYELHVYYVYLYDKNIKQDKQR